MISVSLEQGWSHPEPCAPSSSPLPGLRQHLVGEAPVPFRGDRLGFLRNPELFLQIP